MVWPYAKLTPRNSTSPLIGAVTGSIGSVIFGTALKISWSRPSDAQPAWNMLEIQPMLIIGICRR